MKTAIYAVLGVLFGITLVIGAVLKLLTASPKVDVNDPAALAKYKTRFEQRCFDYVANGMKKAAEAADYQQEALIKQICGCDANAMVGILRRDKSRAAVNSLDAKTALAGGTPEMRAAFKSCAAAYGVTE
jgi:hypothetical protein